MEQSLSPVNLMSLVDDAVKQRYPDASVRMGMLASGRLFAFVVSKTFDGLDQVDRQEMVRDLIRYELGQSEKAIGFLYLHTPEEYEAMTEAQAA